MKNELLKKLFPCLLGSVLLGGTASAQTETEKLPAFPGAEGFGRYVTGGRGGAVYHVTNLNDSGEGSLRWALSQKGTKTIVFDVSGTIHLESALSVSNGNVTIAGQTAPGDGICVADYPFTINASNVIIRFMRFRLGNKNVANHEGDGLGGMDQTNVMVDHCSVSWSVDECLSVYGCHNLTVQWCIVSQSMINAGHSKGSHGYGGNWGGSGASYHHNLVAHHSSRTPRLGPRQGTQTDERMDMRNNVIYNWSGNGCYGGEGMNVNIVNNYYKPGPATLQSNTTIQRRIAGIGIRTSEYTAHDTDSPNGWDVMWHVWGDFYVDGNVNSTHSDVAKDNWTYGMYNQISNGSGVDYTYTDATKDTMRIDEPIDYVYVTTHDATTAYSRVLDYAGASLSRDWVDSVMVSDTRKGVASATGSGNRPGLINSQDDNKPSGAGSDWSAWPELVSTACPTDTDQDGMPDEWETANGLNPNDANDRNTKNAEGYTMLELYMNSLVAHIMDGGNEGGEPTGYTVMEEVSETETVTLSSVTALCNGGDLTYTFENGYSITNGSNKGYATGKENGIKYSAGVEYTIKLPENAKVTAITFTGYDNYETDSYIASLAGTEFGATDYVFPAKVNGNYTVASHTIDLASPVTGSLPFKIGSKQTVLVIDLTLLKESSGVETVVSEVTQPEYVDVYSVYGQLLRKAVYYKQALHGLPSGIYIVGGKKVVK